MVNILNITPPRTISILSSRHSLADSFSKCLSVIDVLEHNKTYLNQNPKCEPQLGKRGLYEAIGGQADRRSR